MYSSITKERKAIFVYMYVVISVSITIYCKLFVMHLYEALLLLILSISHNLNC